METLVPSLPASRARRGLRAARSFCLAMAAYVAIGGVVSFSGWVLDRPRLADWGATGVATQPNAALAALLAGSGLVAAALRRERVAWLAGGVVLAIGAATLCEHVYGVDLGIDTLFTFGRSWGARKTLAPGRMGPPGALCWTCVGLALLLPALGPRWRGARPVLGLLISGSRGSR
ncbi:MAG: hypothetical protein IPK07_06460 [Deltaproteobacteria bacterium]|nr:hypothetical protein [Deltaproteobacteria bacterium]